MFNVNDILENHCNIIDNQIEANKTIDIILDEMAIENLEVDNI